MVLAKQISGNPIYAEVGGTPPGPARPIRGVVREKATGQPVAGAMVWAPSSTLARGTTNTRRLRASRLPKSSEYELMLKPASGQPFFSARPKVSDTAGLGPIEVDFELVRGIVIRGRLTDGDWQAYEGRGPLLPAGYESPCRVHRLPAPLRGPSQDDLRRRWQLLPRGPSRTRHAGGLGWGGVWTRHLVARIDSGPS